jgi:hypothetical protein
MKTEPGFNADLQGLSAYQNIQGAQGTEFVARHTRLG